MAEEKTKVARCRLHKIRRRNDLGSSVPSVEVECLECGARAQSFGRRGRSVKKCLAKLEGACEKEAVEHTLEEGSDEDSPDDDGGCGVLLVYDDSPARVLTFMYRSGRAGLVARMNALGKSWESSVGEIVDALIRDGRYVEGSNVIIVIRTGTYEMLDLKENHYVVSAHLEGDQDTPFYVKAPTALMAEVICGEYLEQSPDEKLIVTSVVHLPGPPVELHTRDGAIQNPNPIEL